MCSDGIIRDLYDCGDDYHAIEALEIAPPDLGFTFDVFRARFNEDGELRKPEKWIFLKANASVRKRAAKTKRLFKKDQKWGQGYLFSESEHRASVLAPAT